MKGAQKTLPHAEVTFDRYHLMVLWHGVLRFFTSRITSGIVEGLNRKIKTAMKRAYGFKTFEYLRTIIYLVAGKLNFHSPTQW